MPNPGENETQQEFVSRCIPMVLDDGTAKDQKQAAAICYSKWRDRKKETDADETKCAEAVAYRPAGGATTFAELREANQAREAAYKMQDLTWQYNDLIGNILASDVEDKAAALRSLTEEFLAEMEALPKTKSLWQKVKELVATRRRKDADEADWPVPVPEPAPAPRKESPFLVWKEAGGSYRWLSVYSSKFRDDDKPPEILSSDAHKEFVAACDKGDWPMPELWLWHVKGTLSGRADWVAYDESGFALASGTFDPNTEAVAERLATYEGDLLTSHGMPAKEIERSVDDPTVITRYRTREISPLPAWAAANKNTGFYLLKEVDDMALPEEKRRWLADILGEEKAAQIEASLEAKGKALADEGVEFKEAPVEAEAGPVDAPAEAEVAAPAAAPEAAAAPTQPDYPTRGEVAEAVAESLKPILERIDALGTTLDGLGKELKEARVADDERFKAMVQSTPAASLFAQIQSAIGSKEAHIDGRSELAKAGPKVTAEAAGEGPSPVPLINAFLDAAWNRGA